MQINILSGEKLKAISPEVRNKTIVPTLSTTVQHSFGSFSHSSQKRKRNQIGKEKVDDMIICLQMT